MFPSDHANWTQWSSRKKKKAQTIDMKKGKGEVMEDKNEENNISRRRGKKKCTVISKVKTLH